MTDGFTCTDKETLITYLYGECDPAERRLVESHLGVCSACAQEAEAFRGVRGALAAWAPPERATGFRIVAEEEALEPAVARPPVVLRPRRWWQAPVPGLMRAAAAVLLFAGGAAVANLEIRYDNDGLVVRTGWMRPDARESASPAVVPVSAPAAAPWRADLASLERRLTDRFDQRLVASTPATQPGGAGGVRPLDERVFLSRVEDLITQSEQRTQREMAYRISELSGEVSAQRIADLRRMEQGLGATGAEALQNRNMINYLLTVSQKK